MSIHEWHYDPAPDLAQPLLERLKRFPREPDMLTYAARSLAALAVRASLRAYHRFEVIGAENVPADGSFVLVANHSSHLDATCVLSALPLGKLHRAFSAAAKDYFFESVPRVALAVLVVNALPFDREVHVRQSLQLCKKLLANPGNILLLFPEGTRSTDGTVGPFKPGIGMLVAGTGVPVVPCFLDGAARALPKGGLIPRPEKLRLFVGKPRGYADQPSDKEGWVHVCQDLRQAVIALDPRQRSAPAPSEAPGATA